MKKAMTSIVGGLCMTLLLAGSAFTQEDEGPGVVFVEIYGCTYRANNDMGDLLAVTRRWNTWADQRNFTDYSAQILTPYFYSTAFPYDVIWLGVYRNAEALGAGEAAWLAEGGEMNAAFGEVVECSVHAQYAGLPTHLPAQPPPDSDAVPLVSFQDCSLENERTVPEALQAHREWGDYLAERGSDLFSGVLFPIAGEDPDADYTYKAVTAYPSAVARARALAALGGGGLQRAGQIFGRNVNCDTPRIYTSNSVRDMAEDT